MLDVMDPATDAGEEYWLQSADFSADPADAGYYGWEEKCNNISLGYISKARFPLAELRARELNSTSGNRAPVNMARVDG